MMGALDLLTAPLRALLGSTEDMERDAHTLLGESGELERQLEEAVASIHRTCETMERHVEVVETLASAVPSLTESVQALVREVNGLNAVLAPVARTEADVSRLGHLFGRHQATPSTGESSATSQDPQRSPGS